MESPLYDLSERHTLVFPPKGGGAPVYDRTTQTTTFPKGEGQPVTLEVFLFLAGQGNRAGNERPGLELSDGRYTMQLVGTEGDDTPLKLPETISAGDSCDVTLLGRKGTLTILPEMPSQIPEVSDENGWLYSVSWRAVG